MLRRTLCVCVFVCVCETSGGEFCVCCGRQRSSDLSSFGSPRAVLLGVVTPSSALFCFNSNSFPALLLQSRRALISIGGGDVGVDGSRVKPWRFADEENGQKDTSFLLYRHVMLGILGIAKVKSRNRKEDKSEMGAAAKGNIGISPLAHLAACILWAGQNPGHGREGGHLGSE